MKYRRRTEIIDAFQWSGDMNQEDDPEWIVKALSQERKIVGAARIRVHATGKIYMDIFTDYGFSRALPGYYIYREEDGSIHCAPDKLFHLMYEADDTTQ